MKEPIRPFDKPLLDWLERRVVRFQDRTGIPKWRLVQAVRCVFAVGLLWQSLTIPLWPVVLGGSFCAGMLLFVHIVAPSGKPAQELADRLQLPVPNLAKYCRSGLAVRLVGWIVLALIVDASWSATFIWGCWCVAENLGSLNTWPMSGPTFKERVKACLSRRPQLSIVPSHA